MKSLRSFSLLLAAVNAFGQTLYWDTNGAVDGSGNAAGTWDVGVTSNWSADSTGLSATTTWTDGNAAIFSAGTDGTGGWTVTVSGTVDPTSITFAQNGSKTITGGNMLTTGGLSISSAGRDNANQFVIDSLLTGTGALNIAAHGDLSNTGGGSPGYFRLGNAANDFVGDITITAGLVDFTGDSNFGATANQIILGANGGLLARNANTLAATRTIVLSGGGNKTFRGYGSSTFTVNGAITGTGNVRHTDGGTLVLAGNSNFTGSLDNVAGNTTISGTMSNAGSVTSSAGTLTVSGVLNTTGFVDITNSTLVFSGASPSTYTGYTHVRTGGTLRLDASNVIPDTSDTLQYGNNTFNVNGRTETVRALITGSSADTTAVLNLGAGGNLTVTHNAMTGTGLPGHEDTTYYGKITGAGNITYNHSANSQGNWYWHNTANDFTGNVTITSGRLNVTEASLGNAGNDIIFNGDVVATLGNGQGKASLQQSSAANITLNAGRSIILNTGKEGTLYSWGSFTMQVDGQITGGGNLRKEDGGVLLLNNTGNNYGGVTKVILGEIRAGAAGVLPDTTELVMAGGTVNLNGFSETVESVSGASGTITGTAASTLTLLTSGSKSYSGAITGGLAVNMNGAGVQTLAGAINTVATVNINSGTLRFGLSDRWGNHTSTASAVVTVNAGATLESVGYFNTLVNPVLAGGTVLLNGGASANYPAFAFKGTVTVTGSAASNINVGTGANNVISIGATEANGATTFAVADVTGGPAADLTINAPLKNNRMNDDSEERPSELIKTGAGTLTLNGNNLYTGATSVYGGALIINGTHVSSAGLIQIEAGASLGGTGTTGDVALTDGATFSPGNSAGVFTVRDLYLSNGSILEYELAAPNLGANPASDRIDAQQFLQLDGTINITALSGFDAGSRVVGDRWLLATYASGNLNDATLEIGSAPALSGGLSYMIDTATDGQVYLAVVPEAGTGALLLLGLAVIARRRRA
jgi:fibronectin-binding autotransporter adhesin